RCDVWRLQEPEVLTPWRLHDAARYERGLPWDDSLTQVAAHVLRGASPLLDQVSTLMPLVEHFAAPLADVLTSGTADAGEVCTADPTAAVSAEPGIGRAGGPTGFIERLDWYRELLADTLESAV